jgi:hypothetical protein
MAEIRAISGAVLTVFSLWKRFSPWLHTWLTDWTDILIVRVTFLLAVVYRRVCIPITHPMNESTKPYATVSGVMSRR